MDAADERQAARDRAADAIATREQIRIGPNGWQPPVLPFSPTERQRRRRSIARRGES